VVGDEHADAAMPQPGAVSNCSPLLTLRPGEELAGNITTT